MCGIAGIVGNFNEESLNIKGLRDSMRNRGPDSFNFKIYNGSSKKVVLFHSRLAIIDLDKRSNQPFERYDYSLIFNGEIYNYIEIRKELEEKGVVFTTESDTEVIIEAYHFWKDECFKRLEGMWAIALYDVRRKQLILTRDRFGEKPLFYSYENGVLYFASETKYLHLLKNTSGEVNDRQLKRYLVNGYKSLYKSDETYYKNIFYIKPASIVKFDENNNQNIKKYWNLSYKPENIDLIDAIEFIKKRLKIIIKQKLRTDVPLGFCLSGGIDSTGLVMMAKESGLNDINTFSIYDSDERYNETDNIECIVNAAGTIHHKTFLDKNNFINNICEMISYNDAPVSTISFYIESLLAKKMAQCGIKVSITGNGADELFTGYYDHYNFWLSEHVNENNKEKLIDEWNAGYGKFVRNPYLKKPENIINNKNIRDHIYLNRSYFNSMLNVPFDEEYVEAEYSESLIRNRMLNEINHEILPVLLYENDLVFMNYSIENRNPYLDSELAQFLFRLPSYLLVKKGFLKYLLREALSDVLPDKVRLDKYKKGFNASIASLFNINNEESRTYLFKDSEIFEYINKAKMAQFVDNYDDSNSQNKYLFNYICAKQFLSGQG